MSEPALLPPDGVPIPFALSRARRFHLGRLRAMYGITIGLIGALLLAVGYSHPDVGDESMLHDPYTSYGIALTVTGLVLLLGPYANCVLLRWAIFRAGGEPWRVPELRTESVRLRLVRFDREAHRPVRGVVANLRRLVRLARRKTAALRVEFVGTAYRVGDEVALRLVLTAESPPGAVPGELWLRCIREAPIDRFPFWDVRFIRLVAASKRLVPEHQPNVTLVHFAIPPDAQGTDFVALPSHHWERVAWIGEGGSNDFVGVLSVPIYARSTTPSVSVSPR